MSQYIYGYARVSTKEQDLNRQINLLESYDCNEILTEKMTGTKADRPELERLLDKLRLGDTLFGGESLYTMKYKAMDELEILISDLPLYVRIIWRKRNIRGPEKGKKKGYELQSFGEKSKTL